jgi:hypothetical protein
MKKLLCFCCGLLLVTLGVRATPLFSDNFDSYTPGNLVGQAPWVQTGTVATTPIQVGSGVATLFTGQDAYAALPGGPVTIADGTSFYMGLDLNVTTARSGDYFLHYSTTVGNTSTFLDRLYVQTSGTGFVLGWAGSSAGTVYGTSVLNLGTSYAVAVAYNAVAGTANDTGALYVNGVQYGSAFSWGGGSEASPNVIAEINLRQGGSSSASTLTVDNLVMSLDPADVGLSSIPEPCTATLVGLGLLAGTLIRRRK